MFAMSTSSSTATPPSRSWTARRSRTSWRVRPPRLGYDALALTDHNSRLGLDGVRAGGARVSGCGRSTGRRSTSRRTTGRAAPDAAGGERARAGATSAGSAHARRTRTRATPGRARIAARRRCRCEQVLEHAEGLVCLSGCARQRRARRADACGGCSTPSGPSACGSSCSGPSRATTGRSTAGSAALARRLGVPDRRDRQRPRALARAGAAAGRVRRDPRAHDARRLRAAAARQLRARAGLAGGDGGALRGPSGGGARRRARWPTACAST